MIYKFFDKNSNSESRRDIIYSFVIAQPVIMVIMGLSSSLLLSFIIIILLLLHRKKCITIIKLFKIFYPRLKKFLFGKSNGKSLSNCNRNCQGQTLCLNWLTFLPCTVCTYWDCGLLRKLDKKRSSPIIVLLYLR